MNDDTSIQHRAIDELDGNKVFAGLIVGDTWVAIAVGHVDHQLGIVYPYRWQHRFFNRNRRFTPSAEELQKAIRDCWEGMGKDIRGQYSRFFVCMPPWACRSRDAQDRLVLDPTARTDMSRPRVERGHVRLLEELVCSRNGLPGYVACDIVHHAFVPDTGNPTLDPIGSNTQSLLLQAHLVEAEFSVTRIVLDCLKSLDIDVDVLTSGFTASSANLYAEDKQAGAMLIDVDRWKMGCSFHSEGLLVETAAVEGGSSDVLSATAEALGVRPVDLAQWLNEHEELLRYADPNLVISWPSLTRRTGAEARLGDIDKAAAPTIGRLVDRIKDVLIGLPEEKLRCAGNVVLMGDDPLTLRGLKRAIAASGEGRCEWRVPDRVHGNPSRAVPGYARMIGLMRFGAWSIWKERRQPFLESYRGAFGDSAAKSSPVASLRLSSLRPSGVHVAPRRFGEVVRHWLF